MSWTLQASSLLTPRANGDCWAMNRRVYVLGGTSNGTLPCLTVESAVLGMDGNLGPFAVTSGLPANLAGGRVQFGLSAKGNKVYVVGGADPTGAVTAYADTAVGTVASDGSITWSVGPSLPTPLAGCKSALVGNYLFVVGGNPALGAGSAGLSNTTGTIALTAVGNAVTLTLASDTFTSLPAAGSTFSIPATAGLAVAHAGNAGFYLVTGASTSTVVTATKVRDLAAATVTAPVTTTATTPVSTSDVKLLPQVPQSNNVLVSQIQSDGSLGRWSYQTSVGASKAGWNIVGHQLIGASAKDLYLIGGLVDGITASQAVYRAEVKQNGSPLVWVAQQVGLTVGRAYPSAERVSTYRIAIVGGSADGTTANSVLSCDELVANANGSEFLNLVPTSPLPAINVNASLCTVLPNVLVNLGGQNGAGTYLATVQTARCDDSFSF